MNSIGLTPSQEEALINFQAITDNWDPNVGIDLLSHHN